MKCMLCDTELKVQTNNYYYCDSKFCSILPYSKYIFYIDLGTKEIIYSNIAIKLQNNKTYMLAYECTDNYTDLFEIYKDKETGWYKKNFLYTINSVIIWDDKDHAKKIVEKLLKLKSFS